MNQDSDSERLCPHGGAAPEDVIARLGPYQGSGDGRHKCAVCAYEAGRLAGIKEERERATTIEKKDESTALSDALAVALADYRCWSMQGRPVPLRSSESFWPRMRNAEEFERGLRWAHTYLAIPEAERIAAAVCRSVERESLTDGKATPDEKCGE